MGFLMEDQRWTKVTRNGPSLRQVPVAVVLKSDAALDIDFIKHQLKRTIEDKVSRGDLPHDAWARIDNRIVKWECSPPGPTSVVQDSGDWRKLLAHHGYPPLDTVTKVDFWRNDSNGITTLRKWWEEAAHILETHGYLRSACSLLAEMAELPVEESRQSLHV